jgi:hypothetical protein
MRQKLKVAAVFAGFFLATTTAARADIIADFTGGNGTSTADSFTGEAGSGWAAAWGETSTTGSNTSTVLSSTTFPFPSGGSNYLSLQWTSASSNGATTADTVRRNFVTNTGSGGISVTTPYTTSFYYQLNSSSRHTGDSVNLFATVNTAGTGNTNQEWAMYSSGTSPNDWMLQGGNGLGTGGLNASVDTGLPLVTCDIYLISVTVLPVTGTFNINTNYPTWGVTITDQTASTSFSDLGLRFRDNNLYAGPYLNFYDLAGGNGEVMDESLGNLDITNNVPEPASISLLALTGAFGLARRRRR